jgi:integrase
VSTRRSHGDGSVYEDKARGVLVACVSRGLTADGKRRRTKKTARTRGEARQLLRQMQAEEAQGRLSGARCPTLAEFAEFWIETEAPDTVRATTVATYAWLLRRYVLPSLGGRRLNAISSEEVTRWQAAMRQQSYSTNTIRRARGVFHLTMGHAIRHRYISDNPVSRVKPPKRDMEEETQVRDPLSREEAIEYLRLSRGTSLDLFVRLCLCLGLREGEALGLKYSDIDLDAGTLRIARTLKEGTRVLPDGTGLTCPVVNAPKTKNSRRELRMSPPVVEALERHRREQHKARFKVGSAWQDDGWVFTNGMGGAVWASNVYQKYRRFTKKCGLRYVRIHDLRHTCAVLMLVSGLRLEAVSQALGHSSIAITKDIYAPYVPALANEATGQLAEYLADEGETLDVAVGSDLPLRPVTRTDRPRHWRGDS